MPTTNVIGKSHLNFPPGQHRSFTIRARRVHPIGAATFTVYETSNPGRTLGAGSCPALSARPNYIEITIPQGVAYTVQSLDGDLSIESPFNT
jgi:hypothetical protein